MIWCSKECFIQGQSLDLCLSPLHLPFPPQTCRRVTLANRLRKKSKNRTHKALGYFRWPTPASFPFLEKNSKSPVYSLGHPSQVTQPELWEPARGQVQRKCPPLVAVGPAYTKPSRGSQERAGRRMPEARLQASTMPGSLWEWSLRHVTGRARGARGQLQTPALQPDSWVRSQLHLLEAVRYVSKLVNLSVPLCSRLWK